MRSTITYTVNVNGATARGLGSRVQRCDWSFGCEVDEAKENLRHCECSWKNVTIQVASVTVLP